jgi:hypothetical protein
MKLPVPEPPYASVSDMFVEDGDENSLVGSFGIWIVCREWVKREGAGEASLGGKRGTANQCRQSSFDPLPFRDRYRERA